MSLISDTSYGAETHIWTVNKRDIFRSRVSIICIPIHGHERHEYNNPILALLQAKDDSNRQKSKEFPQRHKLEKIYESEHPVNFSLSGLLKESGALKVLT